MLLLAATVLCGLLWVGIAWVLQAEREEALQAEKRQNANIARVLQEQTVRVLAAADQATVRVRDAVGVRGDPASPPPDLVRLAAETGLVPGILVQLAWVDAQGRVMASNLDLAGRSSYRVAWPLPMAGCWA